MILRHKIILLNLLRRKSNEVNDNLQLFFLFQLEKNMWGSFEFQICLKMNQIFR